MSNHEPYGMLGKTFHYTRDDLAANRAGYMTSAQELEFKFWERKLYSGFLKLPPLKWIIKDKKRKAFQVTGKIKKDYQSKVVYAGFSRGDQNVFEQHCVQVMARDETVTFYVNDKQYNSLPENIEMTLYYDKQDYRILSVEPPYAEE